MKMAGLDQSSREWGTKKIKVSQSEVVDATTLHDFSTAPVVHAVDASAPALKKKKGEIHAVEQPGTGLVPTLPIPATTLASTPATAAVPIVKTPFMSQNGYFENLPSVDREIRNLESSSSRNGKSRKRKFCGVQLKSKDRRRKINVFNLFQSLQSKALKQQDPSFKRSDLTPKERVLRQAELRTKITQMWRELPAAEKDKYREMAQKMQAATMSSKDEPAHQRRLLSSGVKCREVTGNFFKRMRKLEQSAAELALCIGTKVCVMTIADIPPNKKNAPAQSRHYSFAAASDGRGGLDSSVTANDVIMQHIQSQQHAKPGQMFNDFKISDGDQPTQLLCTPTEYALIQLIRQQQWSEATDHFGQSGKAVGSADQSRQSNNSTINGLQQMFDLPLASIHLGEQLQTLRQRHAAILQQQSTLFNPQLATIVPISSGMGSSLVPQLHSNSAMDSSIMTTQRFDTPTVTNAVTNMNSTTNPRVAHV